MSVETAALIAAWVAILLLGLAVGGLMAQVRYLSSAPAAPPGARPRRALSPAADLPVAAPLVALFTSPDCLACRALEPAAIDLLRGAPGLARVVVSKGPVADRERWEGVAVVAEDPRLATAFDVPVVPYVVVVGPDRTVQFEAPAASPDVLEEALAVLRAAEPVRQAR